MDDLGGKPTIFGNTHIHLDKFPTLKPEISPWKPNIPGRVRPLRSWGFFVDFFSSFSFWMLDHPSRNFDGPHLDLLMEGFRCFNQLCSLKVVVFLDFLVLKFFRKKKSKRNWKEKLWSFSLFVTKCLYKWLGQTCGIPKVSSRMLHHHKNNFQLVSLATNCEVSKPMTTWIYYFP